MNELGAMLCARYLACDAILIMVVVERLERARVCASCRGEILAGGRWRWKRSGESQAGALESKRKRRRSGRRLERRRAALRFDFHFHF